MSSIAESRGIPGNIREDLPGDTAAAPPVWKRVLDLFLILVSLPVSAPLMAVIALWIKLVSRGPVLFRQERIGWHEQRFELLKFRTMSHGTDSDEHRNHIQNVCRNGGKLRKVETGKRLFPGARFLRATGLDELPQLLNIVRGEMSLVGPRPCMDYELEVFPEWGRRRFAVLPGLTGAWQVGGKNRTTVEEMLSMDLEYVDQLSLREDLSILARTIPALVEEVRGDTDNGQRSVPGGGPGACDESDGEDRGER